MRKTLAWLFALAAAASLVRAQYNPDALARGLLLYPNRQAWLLTSSVPDAYRFCAAQDPDGTLRGCVTAKELRAKAAKEKGKRKR